MHAPRALKQTMNPVCLKPSKEDYFLDSLMQLLNTDGKAHHPLLTLCLIGKIHLSPACSIKMYLEFKRSDVWSRRNHSCTPFMRLQLQCWTFKLILQGKWNVRFFVIRGLPRRNDRMLFPSSGTFNYTMLGLKNTLQNTISSGSGMELWCSETGTDAGQKNQG